MSTNVHLTRKCGLEMNTPEGEEYLGETMRTLYKVLQAYSAAQNTIVKENMLAHMKEKEWRPGVVVAELNKASGVDADHHRWRGRRSS